MEVPQIEIEFSLSGWYWRINGGQWQGPEISYDEALNLADREALEILKERQEEGTLKPCK